MMERAGGSFRLDLGALASDARALAERTGLEVPLDAPVEGMGVGTRQRLEILNERRPIALQRVDEAATLFLDGVNDISTGGDLGSSLTSTVVLLAVGLVTSGLGLLRAKRMVLA